MCKYASKHLVSSPCFRTIKYTTSNATCPSRATLKKSYSSLPSSDFPSVVAPPATPATNSWYLNTSPRFPIPPACFPKALLPVNPLVTLSISLSVNGRSPGSGAVCSNASLNSAKSICPLSSSSNAEKADRSSAGGLRADSWAAIELRNVGRATVCDVDGGKKAVISEALAESPGFTISIFPPKQQNAHLAASTYPQYRPVQPGHRYPYPELGRLLSVP